MPPYFTGVMEIKIVNRSGYSLPAYETEASSGMDIRAKISSPITLKSLERALVPTGLFDEIPLGYEAQIRPRTGLAAKHGISLVNTPGTIDADYRGEIKVIMINLSNENYTIHDGDRIAQMVISKVEHIHWKVVDELEQTTRGEGGFGHTGK